MWFDEYERMAMHGDQMPDGLSLPYQCYYQLLSALYFRYRRGEISKDSAASEKRIAFHNANTAHDVFERVRSSSERYAKMNIRIERAANAYAKNRTLENADLLYKALYGMEPDKEVQK